MNNNLTEHVFFAADYKRVKNCFGQNFLKKTLKNDFFDLFLKALPAAQTIMAKFGLPNVLFLLNYKVNKKFLQNPPSGGNSRPDQAKIDKLWSSS